MAPRFLAPVTGRKGLTKNGGGELEEGWTGIRDPPSDLVGVRHLFNMLSRQLIHESRVGERNLGAVGI